LRGESDEVTLIIQELRNLTAKYTLRELAE
jgi:hypothetical protein